MVFPFTFNFNVPGLPNPFASSSTSEPQSQQQNRTNQTSVDKFPSQAPPYHPIPSQVAYNPSEAVRTRRISRANLPKINRPRPSPSPSPAPISRKRGWEPTFAEPSASTATLTSTSGYLDTPAKYRDMAAAQNGGFEAGGGYQDITVDGRSLQDEEEMPPMKKRRGLAGSIISTAVSAALIGTAVGLTVYRLWRDRGKDQQQHRIQQTGEHEALTPPPPYEASASKSDWQRVEQPAAVHVTPPTPRSVRKTRPATAAPKRPVVYVRKSKRHGHVSPAPQQAGFLPSSSSLSAARPEFDFGKPDEEAVEDQMDWIGDKLSMLIEQGRRALNAEVVVMSDAKEDEVDDGTGQWEEEDEGEQRKSRSRSGSVRRHRPRSIAPASSSPRKPTFAESSYSQTISYLQGQSLSASPYVAGFQPSSSYETPRRTHNRGTSYESGLPYSASASTGFPSSYSTASMGGYGATTTTEDTSTWESPELRESMERARARMLARRAGAT